MIVLAALALGAPAASADPASCPADARISWARVQLFNGANCGGGQMVVKSDDGDPDRSDFRAFRNWDGKTYDVNDSRSSLIVAAGSCVRLYEHAGYAGMASTDLCAGDAPLYWNLSRFDDIASSIKVWTPAPPEENPPPPPPAPPPPAAPAPAAERAVAWALARVGTRECAGEQPGWVRAYGRNLSCRTNWCAIFVWNAYRSAGVDLGPIAYTEDIFNRAQRGEGLVQIPARDVRRGDLVLLYTYVKKGRRVTHVGLATGPLSGGSIPTVEGNTGDPDAVVTRRRSVTARVGGRALVQMVVRVP
jgi:hypothetical protein